MKRQAIGKKRNEREGPGNGEARAVEEGIRVEGGIEEEEKGVGTVMEEKGRRSDEKRGRRGEENGKKSKKRGDEKETKTRNKGRKGRETNSVTGEKSGQQTGEK